MASSTGAPSASPLDGTAAAAEPSPDFMLLEAVAVSVQLSEPSEAGVGS